MAKDWEKGAKTKRFGDEWLRDLEEIVPEGS